MPGMKVITLTFFIIHLHHFLRVVDNNNSSLVTVKDLVILHCDGGSVIE